MSADENLAAKKEAAAKAAEAERIKKLGDSGCVSTPGLGLSFPGVDPKAVEAAKKASSVQKEKQEVIPDP